MRRREFIAALGGAAVAGPLAARAAIPVVGFLHSASPGPFARAVEGFRGGLNEPAICLRERIYSTCSRQLWHDSDLPACPCDVGC